MSLLIINKNLLDKLLSYVSLFDLLTLKEADNFLKTHIENKYHNFIKTSIRDILGKIRFNIKNGNAMLSNSKRDSIINPLKIGFRNGILTYDNYYIFLQIDGIPTSAILEDKGRFFISCSHDTRVGTFDFIKLIKWKFNYPYHKTRINIPSCGCDYFSHGIHTRFKDVLSSSEINIIVKCMEFPGMCGSEQKFLIYKAVQMQISKL